MTFVRDIFCVKGICTKKIIIYAAVICCVLSLLIVATVVVLIAILPTSACDSMEEDWDYDYMEKWPAQCHNSTRQSPVALIERYAYNKNMSAIKLENFGICDSLGVLNNGHTVLIHLENLCNCERPKLSGALLTHNYLLDNIHFHWPSEHTIDGMQYDLEAHFVFFNEKYKSFEEALEHPYGLTVLGILFTITSSTSSSNFRTIADAVKSIANAPGCSAHTHKPINFRHFLPYDHEIYYTYDGSLTTPNCAEFVNWIVYRNHSNISFLDFKVLTTILNKHKHPLVSNNRPLQDLNDRKVYIREMRS